MDPLHTEIEKYERQRDLLAAQLAEEESTNAELGMQLQQFEHQFLTAVYSERESLARWEQRCADVEAVIQILETCQWKGDPAPRKISGIIQSAESPVHPLPKEPVILSPEDHRRAKDIYRSLARRFHPDLTSHTELQSARINLMAEINLAYQNQDLPALEELSHHPDIRSEADESFGEKWERLVREISLIQKKIKEADEIQTSLQVGELATGLREFGINGEDSRFEPVRESLRAQVEHLKKKWKVLRAQEAQLWLEM